MLRPKPQSLNDNRQSLNNTKTLKNNNKKMARLFGGIDDKSPSVDFRRSAERRTSVNVVETRFIC